MLSSLDAAKNKPVLLAIGPFYDDMIWFEQVLDFLTEIQDLSLYVPRVMLSDDTEIEINILHHILKEQFSGIYYDVMLEEQSALYELTTLDAHTQAIDKIKAYLMKGEKFLNITMLNDELHVLLASQYPVFLPDAIQDDYTNYEMQFVQAVERIIQQEDIASQKVVIVPIFVYKKIYQMLTEQQVDTIAIYHERMSNEDE